MLQINSSFVFFKYILLTALFLIIVFKVFHYFYTPNYCSRLSWKAPLYSYEETHKIKKCVNTYVCIVWKTNIKTIWNQTYKNFTCERRYKPWIINL